MHEVLTFLMSVKDENGNTLQKEKQVFKKSFVLII